MSSYQNLAPLRLGVLCEYGTLNGGEFSLLAVLDQLTALCEISPTILCPSQGPLAVEVLRRGFDHLPVPEPAGRNDAELSHWLQVVIREQKLQLIHANSLAMSRRLGNVADQLPCPATGHLRDIMKLSRAAIASLQRLTGLIAVSDATRKFHLQQGLHADAVHTIVNGIDLTVFQPRPSTGRLHQELGLPADIQLVAVIGQICLRKGQQDLAWAASLLRDRCPRLHYLLIGERHSQKEESARFDASITEIFQAAGIEDRLHRLGFRSEISEILCEVDLLVHPARQEPLGRVLLEAAACGLPIIATNVGGTPEILRHQHSGWLVEAASPPALAAAIESVISSPSLMQKLGTAARETIAQKFPIQQAARQHKIFWDGQLSTL